jgi:hypothetical protein
MVGMMTFQCLISTADTYLRGRSEMISSRKKKNIREIGFYKSDILRRGK